MERCDCNIGCLKETGNLGNQQCMKEIEPKLCLIQNCDCPFCTFYREHGEPMYSG